MKKNALICLLSAICALNTGYAQVSHGGKPLPLVQTRSYAKGLFEEMPPFDVAAELRADALQESDLRSGYRFAYKFVTDFTRTNSGATFTLPDGTRIWRLGIRSKGALSINVLFTEYEVPDGAQVFLYNPNQTQVLGAFNHLNHSELGILPVAPVRGDELIIEYQEPAQASFAGKLRIGEVNHAYRSLKGYEPGGDKSDFYCMPSPICFEEDKDFDRISRSTVLITIDGITACTGVMVNNSLNDGKPYLLTASHCLNKDFSVKNPDYEDVAGRIVCFFNYNSPTCDTTRRGTEEMSVASASFRAVNEKNDMALLELLEQPPAYYQPYYAGWTIEENGGTPPYSGIHHPRASVKRINIAAENLVLKTFIIPQIGFSANAHWQVNQWNVGCTADGSSGSPLFDSNNRVVGLLSGGISTCDSPEDDYYYAFYKAWEPSDNTNEQLKTWLDPANTGINTLDGLDPYANTPSYRLSNIFDAKLQDSLEVTMLPSPASGNMFGTNSLNTTEYAEEYKVKGSAQIDGTYIVTPAITDNAGSLEVEITVYSGTGKPQALIHTERFFPAYTELSLTDSSFVETGKRLNRAQESFIRFSKPVIVSGSFYIGYRILSPDNSSFAAYNLRKTETTQSTAWIHNRSEWVGASRHPQLPFNTSLFIDPVVHFVNDSSSESIENDNPVRLFQDAGHSRIYVLFKERVEKADFKLYAVNGQLVVSKTLSGSESIVPVDRYPSGIYIVRVQWDNISYTQKMVL
ncbi:hypothetical protein AGMMS49574_13660 [Bacteroidia bacterium]|nr:hypothetical protein AGMMS49574_13660 [Bacteroidia bacterium]